MESPEGLRAASSLASTAPAVSSKVNTRVLGTGRRATFARDLFMASPILRAAGLAGQAACSEPCAGGCTLADAAAPARVTTGQNDNVTPPCQAMSCCVLSKPYRSNLRSE